jgi:hypothetical protein
MNRARSAFDGCSLQKRSSFLLLRASSRYFPPDDCAVRTDQFRRHAKTDIHQIAAGLFANLLRFRVSGNPAPLARAVDRDGTSRRHAER